MQQVFLSAQSKSIHAVLVNAIGNVLIDLVLVDHGHGADDGAVAHIPAQREGTEHEALSLHLLDVAAQVLNTHDVVAQQDGMHRLPLGVVLDGLMTKLLLVLVHDAGDVGAGAVLGRVGIEDVVQRLQIEAHALDLVVHQPVGALDGHAGGVHEVVVVLAPALVHAGADEDPVALLDAALHLVGGLLDVLNGDQLPVLFGDIQADRRAIVVLQRQLVGIRRLGNHVGGGVGVGGVVHVEVVEGLKQTIVHGHVLHTVDVEVAVGGPQGIAAAEGMGQVDKNGLTHDNNSFQNSRNEDGA